MFGHATKKYRGETYKSLHMTLIYSSILHHGAFYMTARSFLNVRKTGTKAMAHAAVAPDNPVFLDDERA